MLYYIEYITYVNSISFKTFNKIFYYLKINILSAKFLSTLLFF